MANSRSGFQSGRRNTSRMNKPRVYRRQRWPILVVLLLAIAVVVGIFAYRSSNNDNVRKSPDAPTRTRHYPDLEMTEGAPDKNTVKRYEGFTVSFNPDNRTPHWVGWELLSSEADGRETRSDRFWQDWTLDGCPSPDDYKRSGYDKGHLCPAADQKWSAEAMSDCFVMANMAPQDHALNAGAWKTLEEKERLWAQRDSALIIVAGPIYQNNDRNTIGDGVRIPSAFFKVLLAPYVDKPRAIGFIYPNMKSPGNMVDYSMSVDEVEKITGLDFFSTLPDEIEEEIEKYHDFKIWNRP